MSSGYIRYYAESNRLILQEFTVDNIHPEVEKIAIKTENSDQLMVVIISFRDSCTKEKAVIIGDELINILFDRIAVEQAVPIGEPRREMWIPSCGPNESLIHLNNPIEISCNLQSVRELSPNCMDIIELKEKLQSGDHERNFLFASYRFAIRQKYPIANFMFLYNLLLVIVSDNQKKADELIIKYEPEVTKTESPRKKRNGEAIIETIYTRLRNEIAHRRETSCPESTSDKVESLAGQFQFLIKKAVLDFSEKICPEHR